MKKLCKALNKEEKINVIEAINIEDAIIKSYTDDKYQFYLNSELLDINNRFRVFNYKGKQYISKQTKYEDGIKEIELATKAKLKINNLKVCNYVIKIVEPTMVNIKGNSYIITEYQGTSMQEALYSKNISDSLTIDIVLEILDNLLLLGILYRGFLPRNTIIKDNNIYLLDWEDAVFSESKKVGMNLLWKTNFLLNWGYLFAVDELQNKIKKYEKNAIEPDLLKYENNFKKWIAFDNDNCQLRKLILKTVMFAESKVNVNNEKFYIMPNDLAHLVSDIFNSDIDILFDISCFCIRKKSEKLYYFIIELLSNLIINLYNEKKAIQPYAILIILMIFEIASKEEYKKEYSIPTFDGIDNLLNYLSNSNFTLIHSYNTNFNNFNKSLFVVLKKLINNYNLTEQNFELRNDITKYIWSITHKEGDKNGR